MTDFFYNLMHPLPNGVMTVIVGVLLVYWLFVFLTGAGMDDLDLGFDFDVDVDVDADVPDVDAGEVDGNPDGTDATDAENSPGFFMKFLNFLNVGKVPFMLILSTFKFFTWIVTLITTSFINVTTWGLSSLLILLPIMFICLFFTKAATNPMVKLFKEIGYKGEEAIDFLGRSAKMVSNLKGNKVGCAEVMVDDNPIRINVMSIDGSEINYGDYVIIADESEDKKTYLVSKEMSLRNL